VTHFTPSTLVHSHAARRTVAHLGATVHPRQTPTVTRNPHHATKPTPSAAARGYNWNGRHPAGTDQKGTRMAKSLPGAWEMLDIEVQATALLALLWHGDGIGGYCAAEHHDGTLTDNPALERAFLVLAAASPKARALLALTE
jgi:hypothetical protein